MKTLGGFAMIRDGFRFDYCFVESITCMTEFCDQVSIVDCGSTDGTIEQLKKLEAYHDNLQVTYLGSNIWNLIEGKEKLSHMQNIAASKLTTDYQFLCQMDEVVTEKSYTAIRRAMDKGYEGYMCRRINLWGSPFTQLDVPQNRKPCSTEVIRLTKTGYETYDDGESISAQAVTDYLDSITIFHFGFVRKREVMKDKIKNMQQQVFGMADYDKKLDQCEVFDPKLWFDGDDIKPIQEPLPKIMNSWALKRMYL